MFHVCQAIHFWENVSQILSQILSAVLKKFCILWKRQLTSSPCKTHKHLFFLRITVTSICRSNDFYTYHFIIQNIKDTCTWMVRFNKISTFCCFTNNIKWNCYFLKLATACQWRIWWLLIQHGATVLIHAKVSAVLPSIASVPSMQI